MTRPRSISDVTDNLTRRYLVRLKGGQVIEPEVDARGQAQLRDGKLAGAARTRGERRRIARLVRKGSARGARSRIDPAGNLAWLEEQRQQKARAALRYLEMVQGDIDELTQRKTLADFQADPVGIR